MDVKNRFLKYVSFETTSDENSMTVPSSEIQLVLADFLAKELKGMGLENAHVDKNGYVYAKLSASEGCENYDTIGLIAHMDTSPDVSGKDVKPQIIAYNGGDIALSDTQSIKVSDFPFIEKYIGQDVIVTDGTTLLGADNKAGIAEIFTAVEHLINHSEIKHGEIAICITPDEEIGRGADYFDIEKFNAKYAYTVDGGELPEIEYENFNGASAKITVNGINIHPGSAKNKMKNAVLLANKFISMLPEEQTPAHTEKYEGFYHVTDIEGNETLTTIHLIIRDHDRVKFENKKEFIIKTVEYLNGIYGGNTFVAEVKDSYYNMKEMIIPHFYVVEKAQDAIRKCGLEPKTVAIRGGTDGARLSFMGLPCPNLPTGAANFHSIHEFVSVQSMEKVVEILIELLKVN